MFLARSVPGFPHISPREMCHARPALLTVLVDLLRSLLVASFSAAVILFCFPSLLYILGGTIYREAH